MASICKQLLETFYFFQQTRLIIKLNKAIHSCMEMFYRALKSTLCAFGYDWRRTGSKITMAWTRLHIL